MKHYKLTFGFVILLLSTLLFPIAIFKTQDYFIIHKKTEYKNPSDDSLLKKHPIIASVYANYYQYNNPTYLTYSIKNLTSYSLQEQENIQTIITQYKEQIQSLLTQQVISKDILTSLQEDTITYGTITDFKMDSNGYYMLEQVASIDKGYVDSLTIKMDKATGFIMDIDISNAQISNIDATKTKEINLAMIHYLGLEKIDDWSYIDNSYQSYQAKLQIYCQVMQYEKDSYPRLHIGIAPIGQHSNSVSIIAN